MISSDQPHVTYQVKTFAPWSDVPLPPVAGEFDHWVHQQGMSPERVMVHFTTYPDGSHYQASVTSFSVWMPDCPEYKISLLAGEHPAVAEHLSKVVTNSGVMAAMGNVVTCEPQIWRVLAHTAYWSDLKFDANINDDPATEKRAAFQVAHTSEAFHKWPLDEAMYNRLYTMYFDEGHMRGGVSFEQFHERWGWSAQKLGQDGHLTPEVMAQLVDKMTTTWAGRTSEEHQTFAKNLFKPHPLHLPLWEQTIERWHLEHALPNVSPGDAPSWPRRSRL